MYLEEFFINNPKIALAFSGGTDSSYLLYAAVKSEADVRAYYVRTEFQPQFELDDAIRISEELGADMRVLNADVLSCPLVARNHSDRCYHCKKIIFKTIIDAASRDGYFLIADGTNASDDIGDRPGMTALAELSVSSPLRECGLTKDDIRRLSKEAGLFTWNKPAYACLATRIPAGEALTREKLGTTESAESFLFSLGFRDFRIRMFNGAARLQVPENQLTAVIKKRRDIIDGLKKYYGTILLDMEVR